MKLPKILPKPSLPSSISKNAKWLSGEGAGSWFVLEKIENGYFISRYSSKGDFECENHFTTGSDFKIDYPSHCAIIHVIQNGQKIKFTGVLK